jgi:YidC/Oxa1 family membrane protein insertase
MCNLPVESLMTSGMLWFPDLTAADPYFILPVLASGSILAIVAVSILALDAFINSAI